MKEIIPLHDYVVLEEIKEIEGALILSQSDQDPPNRAIVIRTPSLYSWNGATVNSYDVLKEGDEVLFLPHMFNAFEVGNKKQLVGKREFIIAILK